MRKLADAGQVSPRVDGNHPLHIRSCTDATDIPGSCGYIGIAARACTILSTSSDPSLGVHSTDTRNRPNTCAIASA